tara:strand:- start:32476 stop:34593 length:2118 start_codon:yes stop_codon:yes gene_type:complete
MPNLIEQLIANIDETNIAEGMDETVLKRLASQVIKDYGRDLDSMSGWSDMVEEGLKLAEQEKSAKSTPWEGASNFKSPAILGAATAFGDRAVTELLRGRDIVKSDIIGRDESGEKRKSADRVVEFMNYQINHQMEGWREGQEKLLYEVAGTGAVFKKTFFDPSDGLNKSELIHYPNFAVNQAAATMKDAITFTQVMAFSDNEVKERIAAGIWSDVDIYADNADNATGTNEEAEVDEAFDNDHRFFEQNCLFDLDEDGYAEPYTVTVHEQTCQVVRIVARYDINSIFIKQAGQVRRLSSADEVESEFEGEEMELINPKGMKLVRIEADQTITDYSFIRNPDGTFLGIGYYHILFSLVKSVNSTTNQLIDSGTLSNTQGGFLAKGFRKKMGNMKVKMGSWNQTEISAIDLANGMQPFKFKEPSPTLAALNQEIKNEIKEVTVNVDFKGLMSPNATATTTLALIQEAMLPTSAIMQRIITSESKEFKKLFILNSKFTDPLLYQEVLDDKEADFAADFSLKTMNIAPTANADLSSRMQRIQQAEAMVFNADRIALTGGDVRPVWDNWFDAMGAEDMIGQVFPDPESMGEEQKARIAQQQQAQQQKQQLLNIEIDHAEREIVRKEAETRAKLADTAAGIRKIESEVILNLEKAETEETKNQISKYSAQLQGLRLALDSTMKELERDDARQVSAETVGQPTSTPTIPGNIS